MYTVIGAPQNRTFRVIWMLEELGEPYERVKAGPRSKEVMEHSPLGKVPVLIENGTAITDSTAILTYLADKHDALTATAGTMERAQQDAITHQILDELEGTVWAAARHSFILPEDKRVPDVKPSLKWEFDRNLKKLEQRMKGPFLMGDQFTIADILLTHVLNWAMSAKFPIESEAMLAYAKSMRARDGFQRAVASEKG